MLIEIKEVRENHNTFTIQENGTVLQGAMIVGKVLKECDEMPSNLVTVRWFDGYLEEFEATEVRFGSDLLWMRLSNGKNRHIPLRTVRWFGLSTESHQTTPPEGKETTE